MRSDDADLIARCRRGDATAQEELYRQHATRLYNLIVRMVRNHADAEEVLQETFLLAFRRLDSFKGEAALATWLYRLGMNRCFDSLRGRAAKSARVTDSLDAPGHRPHRGAASHGAASIARLDLERAIDQLPEGCRAAFLLHDVEGFEHHEVARILGIAEGTSKSQLHKARLRLRALLDNHHARPG